MTTDQYLTMKQAAEIAQQSYQLFRFYVRKKRGPAHHIVAGRKVFLEHEVRGWKPIKHRRGRKPNATKAP